MYENLPYAIPLNTASNGGNKKGGWRNMSTERVAAGLVLMMLVCCDGRPVSSNRLVAVWIEPKGYCMDIRRVQRCFDVSVNTWMVEGSGNSGCLLEAVARTNYPYYGYDEIIRKEPVPCPTVK